MKLDQLISERFKENPADCVIESHQLMIRGGYMKHVGNGVYSTLPPLQRIVTKIEQIIKDEMDRIGGQEVRFPVTMPASLWQTSGRYDTVGKELLRFTDRNDQPMVLGMTHEEAAVHLVMDYANTYTKYPFMIYQIQTKFRDEARPRGGLIRVREFTMKDGYSFHTTQSDLESYYQRCHAAYERIFLQVGLPDVLSVQSDSGMMGGAVSHEFMLPTPVGEDSIAVCSACDYRANLEAAQCITASTPQPAPQPLRKVHTPSVQRIADLAAFLKLPTQQLCKAAVYEKANGENIVVFIRGDLEVSEAKLTRHIGETVYPADLNNADILMEGFIGPCALSSQVQVLFDQSLERATDLCCGANEMDYHLLHLHIERDCGPQMYQDLAKVQSGCLCPQCHQPAIDVIRGIEVGNIFQLGDKYSRAMGMQYMDADNQPQYPLMGCYGIGIGRLAASVCEAHHDAYGPIWPLSIAPWQVHICCIRSDNEEVKAAADQMYTALQKQSIEVIYDDRAVRTGVMLSDADLLGVPIRMIFSPRNMKEECCEIVTRDKSYSEKIPLHDALSVIVQLMKP